MIRKQALNRWLARRITRQLHVQGFRSVDGDGLLKGLKAYEGAASHAVAARSAGRDPDTWRSWRNNCPALAQAIQAAQSLAALRSLERINQAAARGDRKAAQALLKVNSLTRDGWGTGATDRGDHLVLTSTGTPADALQNVALPKLSTGVVRVP